MNVSCEIVNGWHTNNYRYETVLMLSKKKTSHVEYIRVENNGQEIHEYDINE